MLDPDPGGIRCFWKLLVLGGRAGNSLGNLQPLLRSLGAPPPSGILSWECPSLRKEIPVSPSPLSALAPGQTSGRGSGISPLWIGSSPRRSGREASVFHLPPPDLKMPFFPPFPSAQQRNTQINKKRAIPNQVRPEAPGIPAPRGGQGRRSGMSGPQLGQRDPSPSLNICSSGRAWTWKSRNSGAEQERNSCLEPAGFGTKRAGDAAPGVGGEGLGTGRAPGCPGSRVPPSPAPRGISG